MDPFRNTYEALVNALGNCEPDRAVVLAERLLQLGNTLDAFPPIINVDELTVGFRLNDGRLHEVLCHVIVKSLKNVDFDTIITSKYGQMLREHIREPPVCRLLLMLVEALDARDASRVVQSDLFPHMVLPLAGQLADESALTEQIEQTLRILIEKDRTIIDLIDKTLSLLHPSLPLSLSTSASRLLVLRFDLAVRAREGRLASSMAEKIFGPGYDLLTAASALSLLSQLNFDNSLVCLLEEAKVLSWLLQLTVSDDSLLDSAATVLIKMAMSDGTFCERSNLRSLFIHLQDRLASHPILLHLVAVIIMSADPESAIQLTDLLRSNVLHGTGALQVNALNALSLLFSSNGADRSKSLVFDRFQGLTDFIATQIPLKGDMESREAFYGLLATLVDNDQFISPILSRSTILVEFLLDRSRDRSQSGLRAKYYILGRIGESPECPESLRLRIQSYRASGVIGPRETEEPFVGIAESYL